VNLLGEHTDYNDGFVLPTAIPQYTQVDVEPWREFVVESALGTARFAPGEPPREAFARYVYGCVAELGARGIVVPPTRFRIRSQVPMGVGLSSSAALEVATLRALRALLRFTLDDVELAQLAQQAEVRHAGVRCGIMDQMAASLAVPGRALFLDTRTLERRLVALPEGAEICVLDSGQPRALADSGYNARRSECEEAARLLGVGSLRDVAGEPAPLPPPLDRRVRHVLSENARVLRAASGVAASAFGELMNASHRSLRDDYEVSTPELDRLVDCLCRDEAVFGARLTGAGFGGACVALCRAGQGAQAAERALARYKTGGCTGRRLV